MSPELAKSESHRQWIVLTAAVALLVLLAPALWLSKHAESPSPVDPQIRAIDRLLESLRTGNIAFNAPSTMRVDDTYAVHLLLSPSETIEELQQELRRRAVAEKDLQGATIQIASQMEATLSGQNFQILAATPEAQLISSQAVTTWQWDVVPKRGGKQTLHLTLNALLQVNNTSAKRAIRTFDKTIEVNVTLKRRASDFAHDNWQWLWALILGPPAGIIAWLKRRKKKKVGFEPESKAKTKNR